MNRQAFSRSRETSVWSRDERLVKACKLKVFVRKCGAQFQIARCDGELKSWSFKQCIMDHAAEFQRTHGEHVEAKAP